jgi:hypothetical protein
MSTDSFNDLAAFLHFAQGQLREDGTDLSPEECLSLYRSQQASDEDIAAVKEALEAMHRGDVGIPIDEFDHQFRQKNGILAPFANSLV